MWSGPRKNASVNNCEDKNWRALVMYRIEIKFKRFTYDLPVVLGKSGLVVCGLVVCDLDPGKIFFEEFTLLRQSSMSNGEVGSAEFAGQISIWCSYVSRAQSFIKAENIHWFEREPDFRFWSNLIVSYRRVVRERSPKVYKKIGNRTVTYQQNMWWRFLSSLRHEIATYFKLSLKAVGKVNFCIVRN